MFNELLAKLVNLKLFTPWWITTRTSKPLNILSVSHFFHRLPDVLSNTSTRNLGISANENAVWLSLNLEERES